VVLIYVFVKISPGFDGGISPHGAKQKGKPRKVLTRYLLDQSPRSQIFTPTTYPRLQPVLRWFELSVLAFVLKLPTPKTLAVQDLHIAVTQTVTG
jgi:hypothetical protein